METADVTALIVVVLLGVAHVVPPMLTFVEFVPRSWMLSAAGGISVSYVFVHLLPEVAEAQRAVDEASSSGWAAQVERHAYIASLAGLVIFYGLERAAVSSERRQRDQSERSQEEPTSPGAFWLSTISFGIYNAIIAYLLVRRAEQDPVPELALFVAALGLHFVINDLGLRHRHRRRYDRFGRPLLVLSLVAGWIVGVATELSEATVGLAVAFLAGGIVLNVIKEEVPSERQSRFIPLAAGALAYTALLLLV